MCLGFKIFLVRFSIQSKSPLTETDSTATSMEKMKMNQAARRHWILSTGEAG